MKKKLLFIISILCLGILCCPLFYNLPKPISAYLQTPEYENINFESKTLIVNGEFDSSIYKNKSILSDDIIIPVYRLIWYATPYYI